MKFEFIVLSEHFGVDKFNKHLLRHVAPVVPGGQLQVNWLMPSVQTPPLRQGLGVQSSISDEYY